MHTFRDLSPREPERTSWRAPALVMAAALLVLLLGLCVPRCPRAEDPPPTPAPPTMLVPTAAGCEGVREDEQLPMAAGETATFDGVLLSDRALSCVLAAGPAVEALRRKQVAALRSWCTAEQNRAITCEGVVDAYRAPSAWMHPGLWASVAFAAGVVLTAIVYSEKVDDGSAE